jgi:PKD repeat protein
MTRTTAAGVLACSLALQGCGLDQVKVPESLIGPSEVGISLELRATPDIVVADGIQTAVIHAVVSDQNGKRVPNKQIVFTIRDESGNTAEIGMLTSPSGARVYGSTTATSDSQGIARVVYTTPERRDFTANSSVLVGARPVGTDANGAFYWTTRIEVRSAEPRRFPEVPGASKPSCNFNIAPNNPIYKEGTVLRFFSTAFDTDGFITRYEWYFGDGTNSLGAEGLIDVQHPYPNAGTYTVTHVVTDNHGLQSGCAIDVTIVP